MDLNNAGLTQVARTAYQFQINAMLVVRQEIGNLLGSRFTVVLANFDQPLDVVRVKQHRAQQIVAT